LFSKIVVLSIFCDYAVALTFADICELFCWMKSDCGQVGGALGKVTITLNDCLACSGCVTSAETVLITQQSQHELHRVLNDNNTSREVDYLRCHVLHC